MQATSARESRRAAVSGSSAAFRPTRRVNPNAVRVAFFNGTGASRPSPRSTSCRWGLAPGQPPSMKSTPSSSSRPAMASLSLTDRFRPSCWDPSRSVVSKTWNSAGFWPDTRLTSSASSDLSGSGRRGNKKPPVGTGGWRAEGFSALSDNHHRDACRHLTHRYEESRARRPDSSAQPAAQLSDQLPRATWTSCSICHASADSHAGDGNPSQSDVRRSGAASRGVSSARPCWMSSSVLRRAAVVSPVSPAPTAYVCLVRLAAGRPV